MRGILRVLDGVTPGSGAIVMGTGIVSMAVALDGHAVLARVLLAVAATEWMVLGAVLGARLMWDRRRVSSEASSPAGLTGVAATTVLGARLVQVGWTAAGVALLALAFVAWGVLMPIVLRRIRRETDGTAFMVTVATEGVAGLSGTVALTQRTPWLVVLALVLAVAGLLLYPLVLVRFDPGQLRIGRGDQWVAGGSLAISALALAEIAQAAARVGTHGASLHVLQDLALAVWAAAVAWLPPLVLAELRWPRLRYETRRWSTVFPLGMYAACSFSLADVAGIPGIGDFASVWVWFAVAAWAAVFAAMVERTGRACGLALTADEQEESLGRDRRRTCSG